MEDVHDLAFASGEVAVGAVIGHSRLDGERCARIIADARKLAIEHFLDPKFLTARLRALEARLDVSAARRRGVSTDVTLRISAEPTYGLCHPQQLPAGFVRPPYPTLYNPVGATESRMTGDCSTNGFSGMGNATTLRTDMSPDSLLDHYGRQLQDSGWKSTNDAKIIVGRSWTRPDSTGSPMELSLTVATSMRAGACREVNLQVRTGRRP
jgi:hypothetical protein